MNKLLLMMVLAGASNCYADIYKCVDKKGNAYYSDQACVYKKKGTSSAHTQP